VADYGLLRQAARDLEDIAEYSTRQFGVQQARIYGEGLLKAIERIAEYPLIGSDQSQVRAGLRRHVHAAHAIYYRVSGSRVIVLRILGPGQDPLRSGLPEPWEGSGSRRP